MRLALFLLLFPAFAYAQPSTTTDPHEMRTDDCARARKLNKTCIIDIKPEDIEGGVVKPDGSILDARQFVKHTSLIRIRRDFIDEILKTANDVD